MQTLFGTVLQPRSIHDCQVIHGAAVTIGDDGRIASVQPSASQPAQSIGGPDCWVLPGFVDAHLHMPQWDRRGIDGLTLDDWQAHVGYPAEARMRDRRAAEALAEQFVSGLFAMGTTTVAAFGSPFADEVESTFQVFARRGLRAIYGQMLNDTDIPDEIRQSTDQALDQSRLLAAKWHGAQNGRLRYAFSPRTSVRCSEKLMRGSAALADMLGCHLQTHVAETYEELAAVRERFPEQVDEIDLFNELGLLTPRTLLAHGLFLNHHQRKQVAQKQTSLVHCPTANLFRESGLMDYVAHRSAGIRIALGSSVAGGPDPFMPRVAAECLQTAKAIKVHTLPRSSVQVPLPAEAWWMLTRGGAEALGMADRIGAIEPGMEADCLLVRPEKWIADLPAEQQVSALLYTLSPGQIEQVFVAGKRVKG